MIKHQGDVSVVGTRHGSTIRSCLSPDRWAARRSQSPLWRARKAAADAQDDSAGTGFPAVILRKAKDLSRRGTPRWRAGGEITRLRPRDDWFDVGLHSPWQDFDIALDKAQGRNEPGTSGTRRDQTGCLVDRLRAR